MSSEEATAGSPRSAMDAGQHETAIADSPFGGQTIATNNAQNEYNNYLEHLTNDITERYDSTCLSAVETFTMTFPDREHHYTLYY